MFKMLREANPGLQRRFSPESAFHFADFSDEQLEELLHRTAAAAGLKWSSRKVRKAALGLLIGWTSMQVLTTAPCPFPTGAQGRARAADSRADPA